MQTSPVNRSGTAFVFAAGGSLGAVEVGMLRALAAAGVVADFVVGSSVGAINAACYAADPTAEGVARLERIWRRVRRREVFPLSAIAGVVRLVSGRDHLVSPAILRRLLEQELPFARLEHGRIPCHVMATDLLERAAVRLSSGPAVPAVLASTAIPGVFPPVRLGSRTLVDGAVASGTPVTTAVALGAARVVVLSSGFPCALARPPAGVVALGLHALNILIVNQLVADLERVGDGVEIAVVPPLCPLSVSAYDFSHSGDLIDRAAASAEEWLRRDGLGRREIPPSLRPHRHV
jgi:NTE family protein